MSIEMGASEIWTELKRSARRIAIVVGCGAVILAAVSLFTAHPVATFFRLLSYVATGLLLLSVSVAVTIVTFRKARRVEAAVLVVSVVTTLLSTTVSLLLAHGIPWWPVIVTALVGGTIAGFVWSRTTLLFVDGADIRARGTLWTLAFWAGSFALNQLLATWIGYTPTATTALMLFGAGFGIGNTLGLLIRARRAAALVTAGPHPLPATP